MRIKSISRCQGSRAVCWQSSLLYHCKGIISFTMAAGGSEQRRCGLDGCLKPCEGVVKDVLEKQPAGFGHEAGAPNGYPEGLQTSPSVHDRQHRLPVAPVSGLSVGPSGVHAQSAGQHQGALLPSSLLQKPLDGVSYPQLQPLLALLSAAQQSKPGLLMRSSSCEVPTGSSRKLPHKRTPNVLYKVLALVLWMLEALQPYNVDMTCKRHVLCLLVEATFGHVM